MSVALQSKAPSMSEAEWNTRCELAAVYHVLDHLGWTDLINTHMSARVPGEPDCFLINNYGEMFDEITASSLVKMDMAGNVIGDAGKFNAAGFTIHSGVYKARPDANCVLHTHTRAGAGLSLLRNGLRPISQDALSVLDDVVYHEYGVPASQEECEALGRSLSGGGSCVVLLNHGLLTLGHTIHGAMFRLYMLERACEVELIARTLDEPPVMIAPEVVEKAALRMKKRRATEEYGLPEWQGLVRTVERRGFDWRRRRNLGGIFSDRCNRLGGSRLTEVILREGAAMARLDRQVIGVVARQFAQPEEGLRPSTRLVEDLQGDSLDSLELQMEVEARFEVLIDDDLWCAIDTIGDIASQIAACRRAERAAARPEARRRPRPGSLPGAA